MRTHSDTASSFKFYRTLRPASTSGLKMSHTLFSPERCADLHNQLVGYAVEADNDLAPHITRNKFHLPEAPTTRPDDPSTPVRNCLSDGLILFLESIDTWNGSLIPFANLAYAVPPILQRFWDFAEHIPEGRYQNAILLYGDSESSNSGGLFFDMDTNLVYWQLIPGFVWPNPEDWVPLELALTKWLKMWEVGKVEKLAHGSIGLRQWCDWELERDLEAWDDLLQAIELKMPDTGGTSEVKRGMVDRTILGQWRASSFTRRFLGMARAPRKAGLMIAPGIGTFTTKDWGCSPSALIGSILLLLDRRCDIPSRHLRTLASGSSCASSSSWPYTMATSGILGTSLPYPSFSTITAPISLAILPTMCL